MQSIEPDVIDASVQTIALPFTDVVQTGPERIDLGEAFPDFAQSVIARRLCRGLRRENGMANRHQQEAECDQR